MKKTKDQLETVVNKIKNLFSLEEAMYLCFEILPDIATVLNIIAICPASGALVERGFSLVNLIMNDLRSLMNIRTLDATIRIHIMALIYLTKRLIKSMMYGREGETEELNCEFI